MSDGIRSPLYTFCGQLNLGTRFPENEYQIPSPTYFFDDFACRENKFFSDCFSCDDQVSDFDRREDWTMAEKEEHINLIELSTYEQQLSRQRELIRLKLAHGFKQLQSVENNRLALNQLIRKRWGSRQVLKEEENEWGSKFSLTNNVMNNKSETSYLEVDNEKESWSYKSADNFTCSSEKTSEQSDGKNSRPKQPPQKTWHCRHFLKGHCERGDTCGFRHDRSVFCTNKQKVFLGGLPTNMTSSLLTEKLAEQGYTVLNPPKILRGFSPNVCLGSVEEAKKLIEKGSIFIDGTVVRVRSFEGYNPDNIKSLPDEVERSVFLGGLTLCTTSDMIKDELGKLGIEVVNIPVVKTGYSPQVTLGSAEQAQALLKLKQVQISGVMVSVRPFANIRKSSGRRRKRTNK